MSASLSLSQMLPLLIVTTSVAAYVPLAIRSTPSPRAPPAVAVAPRDAVLKEQIRGKIAAYEAKQAVQLRKEAEGAVGAELGLLQGVSAVEALTLVALGAYAVRLRGASSSAVPAARPPPAPAPVVAPRAAVAGACLLYTSPSPRDS